MTVGLILVDDVAAHDQQTTHRYIIHYPEHLPRADDPYYAAFEAYHKATEATAKCYVGMRIGFNNCAGNLELHHAHVEFSLANGVDPKAIMVDFPALTDQAAVQKWVESDQNFRWLCVYHHRGGAGAHSVAHADWEAGQYIPGLLG